MRAIKYIIIHCTAGPKNQTTDSIKAHWKSLGWKRFGYHHLIAEDGKIENITPIEEPSNGVAGYNASSIHISYKGGVKDGKPYDSRTDAQKASIEMLVRKYHEMFPDAKILGHRDFSPDKNRDGIVSPNEWMKACPSFSVSEWLKSIQLDPNATPPVVRKTIISKGGVVNVRKENNTTSAVVYQCAPGTAFIVKEVKDGWSFGTISDKIKGWIRNDFIQ